MCAYWDRANDSVNPAATLGRDKRACAAASSSPPSGDKKKPGGAGYLSLSTLTAMIIRPDGERGVLTAELGIDTPDPALLPRVMEVVPRLRDAYNATMRAFGASLRPGAAPDLDALEARLQADTDRIVGRPGARILLGTTLVT
jgi:hypothetical protein